MVWNLLIKAETHKTMLMIFEVSADSLSLIKISAPTPPTHHSGSCYYFPQDFIPSSCSEIVLDKGTVKTQPYSYDDFCKRKSVIRSGFSSGLSVLPALTAFFWSLCTDRVFSRAPGGSVSVS